MKISKGSHKQFLLSLFYQPNPNFGREGQPELVERDVPKAELLDACGAMKKLSPKVTHLDENGVVTEDMTKVKALRQSWNDEEIEFVPGEVVIIKKLYDGKVAHKPSQGELIAELDEIFNPKA